MKPSFKTILLIFILSSGLAFAQKTEKLWHGKKCAVVLTYDDALNIHLDKVIPMLNEYNFKGTFYLIGGSPNVANRIGEWRTAAANGHELGNHTLNHPCDGTLPNRDWVSPESDLSKYTVARAVNEIKATNALLKAIDGKDRRTFAYPCGDMKLNDTLFYEGVKNDFVAARGVVSEFPKAEDVNLTDITAFMQVDATAKQMIAQIEEAEQKGSFIVLLFHGVGGEHHLNIKLEEHRKLLEYLTKREKDIWVATMVDVAEHIKKQQEKQAARKVLKVKK